MRRTLQILCVLGLSCLVWASAQAGQEARSVTDMFGRQVALPAQVERVVTAGGTPAVNAFICALGKGSSIVNGVPPQIRGPRWKYQFVFAPQIKDQPAVSSMGPSWAPDLEALLALPNDLVIVDNPANAEQLEKRGIRSLGLSWRGPQDIVPTMELLGRVLGAEDRAAAYAAYYKDNARRVFERVGTLLPAQRPTAIYLRSQDLMATMVSTAKTLIELAGGRYAAPDLPVDHPLLSVEQLLAWDPDVLLVWSRQDVATLLADPRLAGLKAVRAKAIVPVPWGAHGWTHYTPEQALAVLWMAKTFYPQQFADVDMTAETRGFYHRFFGKDLSDEQLAEILAGAR